MYPRRQVYEVTESGSPVINAYYGRRRKDLLAPINLSVFHAMRGGVTPPRVDSNMLNLLRTAQRRDAGGR